MLFICIVLSVMFFGISVYLLLVKQDIRNIHRQLNEIIEMDTNTQLTTNTFDKDITALTKSINCSLQENRRIIIETNQREAKLKRILTNISHDLRTPLTSAAGYLQLLEKGRINEEQKRYMSIIHERLDALVLLTQKLFEFTRITESSTSLEVKKLDIAKILRNAAALFYSDFINKNFIVEIDIPDESIYISGDENTLERILNNIFQNTLEHGIREVQIQLTPDGEIRIGNHVRDIKEIEISHLFDRFYTADASRTGRNTGLGLAIIKDLIDRMNGQIDAKIENESLVFHLRFSCVSEKE